MDKYQRLAKDSIIYLIGSFGSKLVSLVMVSFYTFKITSADYGKIDITLATLSLLMPIISLYMHSATLRFSIENPEESFGVITNSLCSVLVSTIVFSPLCIIMSYFNLLHGGVVILLTLILFEGISLCLSQYSRAIGNQAAYAISGILGTFVLAGSNILILNYFDDKVVGYFVSIILSYLASSVYLFFTGKVWKKFRLKNIDLKLYKSMLKYSIPLIPNGLLFWVMSVSDKYTLLFICGTAANGLYGVAGKMPVIMTTFTNTFMGAWRNTAILEDKAQDKNEFKSRIFGLLAAFHFIVISGILIVVKYFAKYLLGAEYIDSWKYVPFLLLAAMFNCFTTFLETEYVVKKNTIKMLKITLIGAILNIGLNIPLIYLIGINGAAIATAISSLYTWVARIIDTKQYAQISYNVKILIISMAILLVQIGLMYITSGILQIVIGTLLFFGVFAVNFNEFLPVLIQFKDMVFKKMRKT